MMVNSMLLVAADLLRNAVWRLSLRLHWLGFMEEDVQFNSIRQSLNYGFRSGAPEPGQKEKRKVWYRKR